MTTPDNIIIYDERICAWSEKCRLQDAIAKIASAFFTKRGDGYWCPIYIEDNLGGQTHGRFARNYICDDMYPSIHLAMNVGGKPMSCNSIISTLLHEIKHFLDFKDGIYLAHEYKSSSSEGYDKYYNSKPEIAARLFEVQYFHLIARATGDYS